jgi:cobalt-zinc-cadmium resistance protein CzcA
VFLILILFLGSPRSAFVVAVSIPMALVSVFSLLNLTKVSANLLSLGAIDFGILVDGAIVVTEAVLRRREAMPDEELSESEVKAATLQVTRPIFFASLIIITAYLPLFSFERAEAKLFTPMAYTMGYALFGALLTALALVPGLAYLAFRKPGRVYHNRWLERLTRRVRPRAGRVPRAAANHLRRGYLRLLAVIGSGAPSAASSCRTSTRARCGCRCRCRPAWRSTRPATWRATCGAHPEVPGGLLRGHADRPQRRRHRSLDHVAHRGAGGI